MFTILKGFLATVIRLLASEAGNVTIEQTWVYRFHDLLHLTYQQQGSLLEGKIDPMMVHRNVGGAIDHHERLGNVIANDTVSPFGQTKILNPEHSRRAATLQSSDAAVLVSDEHTLRSMVEPGDGYTQTIVFALGRRADLHCINAAANPATTATVAEGTGVITYGTVALPASHVINPGTATTAIDNATINKAHGLLSAASVPVGAGERCMLYHPTQEEDIKSITQATSSDFTARMIYDKGTINEVPWNGFTWVNIADVVAPDLSKLQNMLPSAEAGSRALLAIHKSALGLSIGRDITTKINERPDLNNSIQIRSLMMQAAVRVWEGGVVRIDAAGSTT